MRILHLSDTHNLHRELKDLPKADLIIHSGDISFSGEGNEVMDFIDWFCKLDYNYKIFISGNHDFCLDGKESDVLQKFLPKNCYYLDKNGVRIENINFWGLPFFFSDDISGLYDKSIEDIPSNIDILITHRPPFQILDRAGNINYGCSLLLNMVSEIKPKYHLFGHIHDSYGVVDNKTTVFANSAIVNEDYKIANQPFVFEYL